MPSCARYLPTSRLKRMMTSATMLAQISWKLPPPGWSNRPCELKAMRSATLLSAAFSPATLTATSSMSQPLISFAPSSAAVMARIPLPAADVQHRVFRCDVLFQQLHAQSGGIVVPVPNAIPGLRGQHDVAPPAADTPPQEGRPPDARPPAPDDKRFFHALDQSSSLTLSSSSSRRP